MAGYTKEDWMCRRKRRYERVEDAEAERVRLNANPRNFGVRQLYRCPFCGTWHIGRVKGKRYV